MIKENILVAVDANLDDQDLHSEDEVELHPSNDAELEDQIYDGNGREILQQDSLPVNDQMVETAPTEISQVVPLDPVDLYKGIENDPVFQRIVDRAVAEKLKNQGREGMSNLVTSPLNVNFNSAKKNREIVKSPSDTTIYAPGLKKTPDRNFIGNNALMGNFITPNPMISALPNLTSMDKDKLTVHAGPVMNNTPQAMMVNHDQINMGQSAQGKMINSISNFVEQMRLDTERDNATNNGRNEQRQAKQVAERIILDAERFKANIDQAPGNANKFNSGEANILNIGEGFRSNDHNQLINTSNQASNRVRTGDNEFFHITCHIDLTLRQKIERGEFVDLEKLLPKDNSRCITSDESRMELVHSEGATYFVPASERDRKINSVRRWEQAFRVYAAIYCRTNPHRAAEIWQYVYVINLAATSYTWENVASYDFTFRQLMAEYPDRSWALICNQMWNLAMREPVGKGFSFGGKSKDNYSRKASQRDDYCWRFNKNRCRFGAKCCYEHRCFYCDGAGHGVFNCNRKNSRGRWSSTEDRKEFHREHNDSPKGGKK